MLSVISGGYSARVIMRGFTLIEILIVILIISVVSSIGVLTISRNNNKEVEYFAKELTQVIQLAEEQAMLQSTVLGLVVSENSYEFVALSESRDKDNNKVTKWSPLEDRILGRHGIPDHVQMRVELRGAAKKENEATGDESAEVSKEPQLVISANGNVTPFTIYIGQKGAKPRFIISGEADGTITRKDL